MKHDWILDVIADLRAFARQNNLPETAAEMDTAWHLATAEIASLSKDMIADDQSAPAAGEGFISIR